MKEVKWCGRVDLSCSDLVSELLTKVTMLVLAVFNMLMFTYDVKIFLS